MTKIKQERTCLVNRQQNGIEVPLSRHGGASSNLQKRDALILPWWALIEKKAKRPGGGKHDPPSRKGRVRGGDSVLDSTYARFLATQWSVEYRLPARSEGWGERPPDPMCKWRSPRGHAFWTWTGGVLAYSFAEEGNLARAGNAARHSVVGATAAGGWGGRRRAGDAHLRAGGALRRTTTSFRRLSAVWPEPMRSQRPHGTRGPVHAGNIWGGDGIRRWRAS
ncbi:hypothetical protein GQ53DRAFT_548709 [Thozetella sp. PMI_491]|nr:hypothetical protein GQ53DRAFT_548709 [Thozetella sp. PMI_491]